MPTLLLWRFKSEDGVKRLIRGEIKSGPAKFLYQALLDKVNQGPLRPDMILIIGTLEDEKHPHIIHWLERRKEMQAGVLTLKLAAPQQGVPYEKINSDLLLMFDEIARRKEHASIL